MKMRLCSLVKSLTSQAESIQFSCKKSNLALEDDDEDDDDEDEFSTCIFGDFQSPIKSVLGRILTSGFRRSVVDDEKNAYTRNQLAATSGSWSKWTLKMAKIVNYGWQIYSSRGIA